MGYTCEGDQIQIITNFVDGSDLHRVLFIEVASVIPVLAIQICSLCKTLMVENLLNLTTANQFIKNFCHQPFPLNYHQFVEV